MSDFSLGFLAGIALSGVVFLVGLTYLSHVTAAANKELKSERFKS